MKDTIIFTLLALEGLCIIGLTKKLEEVTNEKQAVIPDLTNIYKKGFEDAVNIMVKLYDITGSQACDFTEKLKNGVEVEIAEGDEERHDYN